MVSRFAITLFTSAMLLFACQPMVARMIVPLLGGAPAVWILCSLCFQALVLGGYFYAHVVSSRFGLRTQIILQMIVVASAFLVLPVMVDEQLLTSLTAKSRSLGLLVTLLRAVGVPFFVLSTTSPLLQRWFAESGETDPYHLYAASNAGSMLALLGYPFAIEPFLPLHTQSRVLHVAYAFYAALVVFCAVSTLRKKHPPRHDAAPAPAGVTVPEEIEGEDAAKNEAAIEAAKAGPSSSPRPASAMTKREIWMERLIWVALAFAPSSLLLGCTEFITTDIASVPLLWVVPLALYLASFIVAFAKKQVVSIHIASRAVAFLAAVVGISKLAGIQGPAWLIVSLHLLLLFASAVLCHRALALRRPHHERLTEFYLVLSLGGVLGGAFNGLLAPLLFNDLLEYPIAIALVCFGRRAVPAEDGEKPPLDVKKDLALSLGLVALSYGAARMWESTAKPTSLLWMFVLPVLVAFAWSKHPLRFAVALGGVLLVGTTHGMLSANMIFKERDFYGVLKVRKDVTGRFRVLQSGSTIHGAQSDDPELRRTPFTYYHRTGPCGDVLTTADGPRRIGVIGLGVGSLAAYAQPADTWTFFELNPADVAIAKKYFTYLSDVPEGTKLEMEVGDARLRIRDGAAARFDILVLDAFSSDAIPTHLITREALAIYKRALAPDGVLLAHISNRHVTLDPVFAKLADDAGLLAIGRKDGKLSEEEERNLKTPSHWLVLSASSQKLATVGGRNQAWKPLFTPAQQALWTDDFANVLGAMRF